MLEIVVEKADLNKVKGVVSGSEVYEFNDYKIPLRRRFQIIRDRFFFCKKYKSKEKLRKRLEFLGKINDIWNRECFNFRIPILMDRSYVIRDNEIYLERLTSVVPYVARIGPVAKIKYKET